jgi:hypothetical protein
MLVEDDAVTAADAIPTPNFLLAAQHAAGGNARVSDFALLSDAHAFALTRLARSVLME